MLLECESGTWSSSYWYSRMTGVLIHNVKICHFLKLDQHDTQELSLVVDILCLWHVGSLAKLPQKAVEEKLG